MSDTVIKVENLSKRYVIGHQGQERYVTLRDAIIETDLDMPVVCPYAIADVLERDVEVGKP
jgi:hypothetical protein